jgi:hypothetical protein
VDEGENIFNQKEERGIVNKNYLFIDNKSTADQIAHPNLLKNIRKPIKPITVHAMLDSWLRILRAIFESITVKHSPYTALWTCFPSTVTNRNNKSHPMAGTATESFRSTLWGEWWNSSQAHMVTPTQREDIIQLEQVQSMNMGEIRATTGERDRETLSEQTREQEDTIKGGTTRERDNITGESIRGGCSSTTTGA